MSCFTHLRACRTAATAAVLLLGVALLPPIASAAGLGARATGTELVSAGKWGTTASVTSMVFTNRTFQTSTVTNAGTIALSAESYSITISRPAIGTSRITLFECAVAWVATTCSGGAGTQIGGTMNSNTTTVVTSATALPVAGATYLQVEPTRVISSTTFTISPLVTSPAQLRAAVKTNR